MKIIYIIIESKAVVRVGGYYNKLKKSSINSSIFHKSFEIGILIKAIDGILEIIGGILLIFLNPIRLNNLVVWLTQHELSEDPRDVVANLLIRVSSKFTVNTQYFGVFYLISHGIVKLILIIFGNVHKFSLKWHTNAVCHFNYYLLNFRTYFLRRKPVKSMYK